MLARIRKSAQEKDQGFTLIELLVVMIIIGILAAIAIPVFLNQRENAYRSALESDLRNAAVGIESYAVAEGGDYSALAGVADLNASALVEFNGSDDVVVKVESATNTTYVLTATHDSLEDTEVWEFDKAVGVPAERTP